MGCIYKITNAVNGKAYIGKTKNDAKTTRIREHFKGHGGARILARAMAKYGVDVFSWEILQDGVIPELLDSYEIELIQSHNTASPNGYNLTHGGEGGIHTPESKRKISDAIRGKKNPFYGKTHTPETRQKLSEINTGKKHTETSRRKISESLKGRDPWNKGKSGLFHHTEEHKRSVSERHKGKVLSDETRRKISESHKGKPLSEEHRQTLSKAQKGRNHSLETRRKISESNKGKIMSKEARRKISEARISPEREIAHKFYLTLPASISLKEKRKQVYEFTGNKKNRTVRRWIDAWKNGSLF